MAFVTRNRIITTSLAAASLLLAAACAKVGTLPEAVPAQALSYEVIQDKPDTKADYSTSVPFVSYAWFLPSGKRWDSDKADAKPYIEGATISYNSGRWLDPTTTYYWPKQGSLTFRAYSPAAMPAGTDISVSAAGGVELKNWKLNATTNQETDFMVAKISKDKKANAVTSGYLGVPTLFKHKLAKISVRASLAKPFAPGSGKSIKIRKLTLRHIYTKATFSESENESEDEWSSRSEVEDIIIYENTDGLELTNNAQTLVEVLLIPQHLSAVPATGQAQRDEPLLTLEYSDEVGTLRSDDYSFVGNIHSYIWDEGQHIRYGIVFGTEDEPIDFNAGVGTWTEGNSNNVDIGQD